MSNTNTLENLAKPRRSDRELTDEEAINQLLNTAEVGYIATSVEGQPLINSNLFWYDGTRIFFHTAIKGRTRTNIEANPKVCFTITERGRYLPADEALEFSVEYAGVVVFGKATVLDNNEEKTYALQGLLDKYFPHLTPGKEYRPITEGELKRTSVYAITIDTISGKRKSAPDFPTAGPLRAFYSLDEL